MFMLIKYNSLLKSLLEVEICVLAKCLSKLFLQDPDFDFMNSNTSMQVVNASKFTYFHSFFIHLYINVSIFSNH